MPEFDSSEARARALDEQDPLRAQRANFAFPEALRSPDGQDCAYFAGNSLGLMPKRAHEAVQTELEDWARLAVEGHFEARHPWAPAHEELREPLARLVGGKPHEVVAMNSLTVNLHLLMASFYRPTKNKWKILMEDRAFGSDAHAARSQAQWHGFDPDDAIVWVRQENSSDLLGTEAFVRTLEEHGDEIAFALIGAVNYQTGEVFHVEHLTRALHERGVPVCWDLAHAAGNVELRLHDWGIDCAAWCSYKYLNSGPGGVAGAFIHEKHAHKWDGPRLEGWWGTDPASRFAMSPDFVPAPGADAWQLSNPPILALAPLRASLAVFDGVDMSALRAKSVRLTGYLEGLLDAVLGERVSIVTPRDPERRGAQLSVRVPGSPKELTRALRRRGVVCDAREPDVIRLAPAPLYTSFHDCWRAVGALETCLPAASATGRA